MEEASIIFREIAKYLPPGTISRLSEVNTLFNQGQKTLDWFFWKTKLEEEFGRELNWTDAFGSPLSAFNWEYVYGLFHGSDPKIVAMKYYYDWRIVKLAHALGASFDTLISGSDYGIEDIMEILPRKGNKLSYVSDIYYECMVHDAYQSFDWLLNNVPPSAKVKGYLIAESLTYASVGITEILFKHIDKPTYFMNWRLLNKHFNTFSSVASVELFLKQHVIDNGNMIVQLIYDGMDKGLDPYELMRVVTQYTDKSLFGFIDIERTGLDTPQNIKYLMALLLADTSIIEILINPDHPTWLVEMAAVFDDTPLPHLMKMRPVADKD